MEWCGEQTHITSLGPNVWIGDSARPAAEQGRTVLGAPVGTDDSVQTQIATGIGKPIVTPLLQRLLHRPPSILYFCSTQQTQKQLLPMPPEHTRENTTWQSPVASQIFCKHPPYSQKHSPQHICRLLRGIKAHTSMPLSHTAPPPHTASTKLLPRKCGHQWLSKLAPRQPNTTKPNPAILATILLVQRASQPAKNHTPELDVNCPRAELEGHLGRAVQAMLALHSNHSQADAPSPVPCRTTCP